MIQKTLMTGPIPWSLNGYQKANWYNFTHTQTGSVGGYEVRVYEKGAEELVAHLKRKIPTADISIGLTVPRYDPFTNAHYRMIKILYAKGLNKSPMIKKQTSKFFSSAFNGAFKKVA